MSDPRTARARRWQGSEPPPRRLPVGVVLAGGAGRRLGGAKATVNLGGRPLIAYPIDAVRNALGMVAVLAKLDTELPDLAGVEVWIEPQSPRHPLAAIAHALELADGQPVMICACDMPFAPPELIRAIAEADPGDTPAVVACRDGRLQPLVACYQPQARQLLVTAAQQGAARLVEAAARLGPRPYEVDDPDALFNVNTPDDLLVAAGMLDRRRALSRT